jgi:antitoxin (DNA-binding transcriptional repressor) of toxin-antitoxin stability system
MNSNVKGAVAEQAIVLAATKAGIPVLRPVGEHGRIDLAFDINGDLLRVQVKWGRLSRSGDLVVVLLRTSRCTTHGHVRGTYGEGEVDLFAVYCGELDRSFLLPAEQFAGRQHLHLRLTRSRNGQRACINLADDFIFEGAVAQLARAPRWQRGGQGFESPQLHSNSAQAPVTIGADSCRVFFGYWLDQVAAGQEVVVTRRGKPMIRLSAAAEPSAVPFVEPAVAPAAPLATQTAQPPLLPPPNAESAGRSR